MIHDEELHGLAVSVQVSGISVQSQCQANFVNIIGWVTKMYYL
jgi:hypothetical protein